MPNTMPDMVSRPAVVKKSLLGCEWSRKVQKLKTTKFQNQAVPKPGGAARGGDNHGMDAINKLPNNIGQQGHFILVMMRQEYFTVL